MPWQREITDTRAVTCGATCVPWDAEALAIPAAKDTTAREALAVFTTPFAVGTMKGTITTMVAAVGADAVADAAALATTTETMCAADRNVMP